MSTGRGPSKWILLIAAPLAIALAGRLAAALSERRSPEATERLLRERSRQVQERFSSLLDATLRIAETARDRSPGAARDAASGLSRERLEGTAAVSADGAVLEWSGTPADPAVAPAAGTRPGWSVRVEGLWTRLDVTSALDGAGRFGIATFLLDAPPPGRPFASLLARGVGRSFLLGLEFIEPIDAGEDFKHLIGYGSGTFRRGDPSGLVLPLLSPAGDVVALATLHDIPAEQRAGAWRGFGDALAAVALAALLAGLVGWRTRCRTGVGAALALVAVAVARTALLVFRAPARLLPREWGSPTLYGSSDAFGLFGSPADLALTCLAALLAAGSLASWIRASRPQRPLLAIVVSVAAAASSLGFVRKISVSLAMDARLPVLDLRNLARTSGHLALLLALALALAACAYLVALAAAAVRGSPPHDHRFRATVAAAVLPVAGVAGLTLMQQEERLALDRLRSEFAPQVREQASRRRVALASAVREAARSDRSIETLLLPTESSGRYSAFLMWSAGDLFLSGYRSSLDLYDTGGLRRTHFGFGIPALSEAIPIPAGSVPTDSPSPRVESFREGALQLRVFHAEAPVRHEGRIIGVAVGHVLDEPDNLAFLPDSLPYLSALGFGVPGTSAGSESAGPAYVSYGVDGAVVVSTIAQPPAPSPGLRQAAARGETVSLRAGDEPYHGIALEEQGRLHLLLVPSRTLLDRCGTILRVTLLGLALVGLLFAGRAALTPGAPGRAARAMVGSFHRKLLAAVLLASVVPVLGLSLFVRAYLERRSTSALVENAVRLVTVVKSVVEDYAAAESSDEEAGAGFRMNDEILQWLRRIAGQEIHLYENGSLSASSKRELFSSGLLPGKLPGEAFRSLFRAGQPSVVLRTTLGSSSIPVAYARVVLPGAAKRSAVVAVPLVLEQREAARALDRVSEMLLLASALLGAALAWIASLFAGAVARPVRDLVAATRRIASGDYATRLEARTRDEVAELVEGFNAMAAALAAQRTDLERRRDYIEALLRNATAGVISTDPAGRIVTINPAAAALLAASGAAPRAGDQLSVAVSRNAALAPLLEILAHAPPPAGEPEEVDLRRDGRIVRLRVVRVRLPDPDGGPAGLLLLIDDVTELMRSNQLAAWAEMARAIAHEIKNPLTPIQLSIEHLERILTDRGIAPSPEIDACIETVIKQVRSLREIAAEFSAYAKLPALARVPTDPSAFVEEVIRPYRSVLPPGVHLAERYDPAPEVFVDRRVLLRALVNLVENALQAIGGEGTLSVTVSADAGGREAVLSFGDDGPGLSAEAKARLFEPYFSTKSAGTGLGLAIVRRAVEAHFGRIEVESGPGRGTMFRIRLPAGAQEEPTPSLPAPAPS